MAVVAPAPVVPAARLVAACASALPIVLFQAPRREEEEPLEVAGFGEVTVNVRFEGEAAPAR